MTTLPRNPSAEPPPSRVGPARPPGRQDAAFMCSHGRDPRKPNRTLTFSPLAWIKLQLFLHAGPTEVGGFGVSAADDPLYIADFVTVRQRATVATVTFDDNAVADYFDRCVDQGLPPARFARIWIHTHPADSPDPSLTDERTFSRVFSGCDWAVMFILSRTGRTYARLAFFAGPGGEVLLPVAVDWASWPALAIEHVEQMTGTVCDWIGEYADHVNPHGGGPPSLAAVSESEWGLEELHEAAWIEQQFASGPEIPMEIPIATSIKIPIDWAGEPEARYGEVAA